MVTRLGLRLSFALIAIFASGCGTIASVSENEPYPNIVFGGIRNELSPINGHTMFDLPLSAVADTLVLPYTVPRSIYNANHPNGKPSTKEPAQSSASEELDKAARTR